MKKIYYVVVALLLVGVMSGCKRQNNMPNNEKMLKGVNNFKEKYSINYPEGEDVIFVHPGDVMKDYYEYEIDGQVFSVGSPNLEYIFQNAVVYDSIEDSPISKTECHVIGYDENYSKKQYDNNSFIVVDMTISNTSSEENPENILPIMEFFATPRLGEGYKKFVKDDKNILPIIVYFSESPREGDKNSEGELIDIEKSKNLFRKELLPGESIDFRLGILVSTKLIEQKNVFLYLRFDEKIGDKPIYYVDLLGRYL